MTKPTQVNTPPQQSSAGVSGCAIAVVMAILFSMALGCVGLCGGILFFRGRLAEVAEQGQEAITRALPGEPQTDWNDWMVKRELTHLYQTTLESVVADKAIIEKLGEPIETVIEADELFRREDKGPVNPAGEHIEFDVRGPKGTGLVKVVAKQDEGLQPDTITVTFSDGSRADVKPMHRPLPPVR